MAIICLETTSVSGMTRYFNHKGFNYEESPEETAAAELLESKGWDVDHPACPDCLGSGYLGGNPWFKAHSVEEANAIVNPPLCPRGCVSPLYYF